jgi:N-acetyl-anhydromuramyl-L-alanine amidase AmpD
MKRTIDTIVIHCSATPNGRPNTAADINVWHKERGFKRSSQYVRAFSPNLPNIGYHAVIERDGNIVYGRHLEEIGAHVVGHNAKSIGICMVGTDQYSSHQWDSLQKVIIKFASDIYGKPTDSIKNALAILKQIGIVLCGHRDLSPDKNGNGKVEPFEWLKTCPGFDVTTWVDDLRRQLPGELHVKPI